MNINVLSAAGLRVLMCFWQVKKLRRDIEAAHSKVYTLSSQLSDNVSTLTASLVNRTLFDRSMAQTYIFTSIVGHVLCTILPFFTCI